MSHNKQSQEVKRVINICGVSKCEGPLHGGALITSETLEKSTFILFKQTSKQERKELKNIS